MLHETRQAGAGPVGLTFGSDDQLTVHGDGYSVLHTHTLLERMRIRNLTATCCSPSPAKQCVDRLETGAVAYVRRPDGR